MNKEEFLKKYKGKAVHCNTEEKANEFLGLCDKFGIKWWTENKATEFNLWSDYKENTCYRIDTDNEIYHCIINYYKNNNCEIIEFQSLKNNKTKPKKIDNVDCIERVSDLYKLIEYPSDMTNKPSIKIFNSNKQIYDIIKKMLSLIEKLIDKGDGNGI